VIVTEPKRCILFSTPRSGSSPVYELLLSYFAQERGCRGLGEYFNLRYQSVWSEGQTLTARTHPLPTPGEERPILDDPAVFPWVNQVRLFRLDLLKGLGGRCFLKMFPDQIPAGQDRWLCDSFDWIFLERIDLFDQLLSYIISVQTNIWYRSSGIDLPPGALRAEHWIVKGFEHMMWRYMIYKARLKASRILYYEDFCAHSPAEFLKRNGFDFPCGTDGIPFPEKQNKRPKEEAFSNLSEIRHWFSQTMLPEIASLRAARNHDHVATQA
jgi:hypothetical protein